MILLYCGRRPSDEDGPFPPDHVEFASERLDRLISGLRPRLAIGSAAAGADLLALRSCLDVDTPTQVILAGSKAEFRSISVADKGEAWTARFDGLMQRTNLTVEELAVSNDDEGYAAVNSRILKSGLEQLHPEEEIVLVAVAGEPGGQHNLTTALINEVESAGYLVLQIDPTIDGDEAPVAFVAMPYGQRKSIYPDQAEYNADASWHRIIVPLALNAGMRPVRVDLDASLEMIDAKMIRAIGRSPFFVADLAQHNPNVFWELGVRHAWVPTGSLLIAPTGTPRPPFDVNHVPVHEYKRDAESISDSDAVAAIRLLQPLVRLDTKVDSPVFAALPTLTPAAIPAAPDPGIERLVSACAERISLAADLNRIDDLRAEVAGISDQVNQSERDWLLEQAGTAFLELDHPDEAVEVLRPLSEADVAMERPILQQRFAHALILVADRHESDESDRLAEAEGVLGRIDHRNPGSGETLGLLGSVAKRRFSAAVSAGRNGRSDLERAIAYYLSGFDADPTDFYPGINAIALLVLRWSLAASADDAVHARELITVLRFMLRRHDQLESVWRRATSAELALYELILGGIGTTEECLRAYALAAAGATPRQIASMRKQLRLLATAPGLYDISTQMLAALPDP